MADKDFGEVVSSVIGVICVVKTVLAIAVVCTLRIVLIVVVMSVLVILSFVVAVFVVDTNLLVAV